MKRKMFVVLVVVLSVIEIASSQTNKKNVKNKIELKNFTDTISYLIGSDVGGNLKKNSIQVNSEIFTIGMNEAINGTDTLFTQEKRQEIMNKFQQQLAAKNAEKAGAASQKNKDAGKAFLAENKKKEGVFETASGLQYKVIKQGEGPKPKAEDEVEVNYEGKFLDGRIFDSSYERGKSVSFPLNGVIKGWTEGLQLMNVGSTYELYIPSDLGYGDKGFTEGSEGATLIFKVELISVKAKQ